MSYTRVRQILISERKRSGFQSEPAVFWPFIGPRMPRPLRRSDANMFVFYCQIDFQMTAGQAPKKAESLVRGVFGTADRLWEEIAGYEERRWIDLAVEKGLHRFPTKTGRAVWRVAHRMNEHYDGDARNIWNGRTSDETLQLLTKTLGIGPQLSRMCVLGLLETGYLKGDGDVKADIHVRRVLGRVTKGQEFSISQTDEVQSLLADIMPKNKWKLDLPLYNFGKNYCFASKPNCAECALKSVCAYAKQRRRGL